MARHGISFLFALCAHLVAGSCRRSPPAPEAVIEGEVLDNFGRPVRGAVATIRDSAFRATTNERGRFELPFAPGSFTLQIEADHCTPFTRDLQVTQAVRYPLGAKMLFRIPETPGETVMVATVDGYQPLPTTEFDKRVVNFGSVYAAFPNRCAVFTLSGPVSTLRGSHPLVVVPDAQFRLVQVDNGHVTTDNYPRTTEECPARPFGSHGIDTRSIAAPDRVFMVTQSLAPGTYCLIRANRFNPDDAASERGHCFRWEIDPQVRWGSHLTLAVGDGPMGQTAEGDHSPNAGGPPVDCPLRNGVIPCTEACYRADARWPGPDDPAAFLASERESGECYSP
jgi:hypothetical protein